MRRPFMPDTVFAVIALCIRLLSTGVLNMGIKELAAKVVAAHPELSTGKATGILRTALEALHQELSASTEKLVKLAPLGHFKLVEKSKEGKDAPAAGAEAATHTRISLHLA